MADRALIVEVSGGPASLPLGVVGDFYVVTVKVTRSVAAGGFVAAVLLLLFYGLWFAFPVLKSSQKTA